MSDIPGLTKYYVFREPVYLASEVEAREREILKLLDAAEYMWGVIANVSGSDWEKQTKEWQAAAGKARDEYFLALGRLR